MSNNKYLKAKKSRLRSIKKCHFVLILYLSAFLIIFTFSIITNSLNAQIYHMALPHFQHITILKGRNISINFITEPNIIVAGHHSELKMSLIDMIPEKRFNMSHIE